MKTSSINQLLNQNNAHIKKLHSIVEKSITEEQLIINNLLHPTEETLTKGQKISDKVAKFGGSWKFIILFGAILLVWILFNTLALTQWHFDPFPFILMNLILSCIAALQAPIIMMSQNRQEEKDRMRSENDYLINLKAELEIRSLHKKIDLLFEEEIKTLFESQAQQFLLLKEIKASINKTID
jgi:uncharacterized membrane protein